MDIDDITLVIPTRGERAGGVQNCVASVGEPIAVVELINTTGWLMEVNDYVKRLDTAFLMGADDMVFHKGAIQEAIRSMNIIYPDENGVIGFNQDNLPNHCEAGFTLIGRKFLKHLKSHGLFCPDYKHYYADTELFNYAKAFGRFYYNESARVDHYHFSVTGEKDSTALISQASREEDKRTAQRRKAIGLLWGRDFDTIN